MAESRNGPLRTAPPPDKFATGARGIGGEARKTGLFQTQIVYFS